MPIAQIHRWSDIADRARLMPAIDRIFFEASATRSFASDAAREEFRERWLGRYLVHDPGFAYVAVDTAGGPIGYLVGCLDDPARAPRFADIGYFARFADLTARFPAHLHVNLAPAARNEGLGGALVGRFAADAASAGAPGLHVVTSQTSRNVAFYERNGFAPLAAIRSATGMVQLFLGKSLPLQQSDAG
jgi:GNAT superfamily N-acetyltransferase